MAHLVALLGILAVAQTGCFAKNCPDCSMYECSTGECIKGWNVCDGIEQCIMGDDEGLCDNSRCNGYMDVLHDGTPDWKYDIGSQAMLSALSSFRFACSDGSKCVGWHFLCNGNDDCADGSDEANCDDSKCSSMVPSVPDRLSCTDGSACYTVEQMCDGVQTCADGSDEQECPGRNTPQICAIGRMHACADNSKCVSPSVICANPPIWGQELETCDDDSHWTDCGRCEETFGNPAMSWMCDSGDQCVWKTEVCNGVANCADSSDEQDCTSNKCGSDSFGCSDGSRCIHKSQVCDSYPNCPDSSDEADPNCGALCEANDMYACAGGGRCMNWQYMCSNFPMGCPQGDHNTCDLETCYQKSLFTYTDDILITHTIYDVALCPDAGGTLQCQTMNQLSPCDRDCLIAKGCVFQDDACKLCTERGEAMCDEGQWLGQCWTSSGEVWEMKGGDDWYLKQWPGSCGNYTVPPGVTVEPPESSEASVDDASSSERTSDGISNSKSKSSEESVDDASSSEISSDNLSDSLSNRVADSNSKSSEGSVDSASSSDGISNSASNSASVRAPAPAPASDKSEKPASDKSEKPASKKSKKKERKRKKGKKGK